MSVKSTGLPGTLAGTINATTDLIVNGTNTGTVGAVTINNNSGRVNIAAAGTTVTVTNNKVTAASHIFLNLETVDVTAKSAIAVAGAGSFVITLGAAATAQVAIDFLVAN